MVPRGGSAPLEYYRSGVLPLGRPAPVREIDLVASIPRRRFVGADEQRPPTPPTPVAGFTPTARVDGGDHTLIRYTAPNPVPVSPAALLAARIGPPGTPSVYIEP